MKATHKERISIAVCALALGAMSLYGCSGGGSKPAEPAKKQEPVPVQVSVASAHIGSIQQVALVTGALTAQDDLVVGAKTAGKLVGVYKREGDPVRAGEIVAQQDTGDLQAQYDQQLANLRSAQTKQDQAQVAYDNALTNLALTRKQTISSIRQAQAALDASKEQAKIMQEGPRLQERKQAQETVASAKAQRDQTRADLTRYRELFRENAISAQQLDQAQAAADSADAQYNSSIQNLSLVQEGNRPEDIRRAQLAVEQANQTLVTAQANRDQIILRKADIATAKSTIATMKAGVEQAAAAVRLAKKALNDATIISPIDGMVQERRAEPGQQLTAGKDVLRIVSLKNITFDAQLPEEQFSQVHIGQNVDIKVDGWPGRNFTGKVYRLFPVASSEARSFTVRVKLLNGANLVRPSMFARGEIVLATHSHAVLIPRVAVLDPTSTDGRVFIVKDNVAHESSVKLGLSTVANVEVLSGAKDGDQVVIVGQAQLQDNTPVQIIPSGGEQASNR